MALRKNQYALVNPKYYDRQHDDHHHSGDQQIDLNANRLQFDNILENRDPRLLEMLDSVWYLNTEFQLDHNGVAVSLLEYPWLNPASAPKAIADLRQALTTSTAKLPHHEKLPFIEKLTEDLTAPCIRPLATLTSAYQETRKLQRSSTHTILNDLTEALQNSTKPLRQALRNLTGQFNQPDECDWTEDLLAVEIASTLRRIADQAASALDKAAAAIAHHPDGDIAQAVFAPPVKHLDNQVQRASNPLVVHLMRNKVLPEDDIIKKVHDLCNQNIQAEFSEFLTNVQARQQLFAQELPAHPQRVQAIKDAMLEARQTYRMQLPGNRAPGSRDQHMQAAFNTVTQNYTPEQRSEAAQTVAEAVNQYPMELLIRSIRHPGAPDPYRNMEPTISELRNQMVELLCEDARGHMTETTRKLASIIVENDPGMDLAAKGRPQIEQLSENFRRWAINRHLEPDFHNPEMTETYADLNQRLTGRIIELLQAHASTLKRQPTSHDLLRDPACKRTMTRFLNPYPQQDRHKVLEHMLQHPRQD